MWGQGGMWGYGVWGVEMGGWRLWGYGVWGSWMWGWELWGWGLWGCGMWGWGLWDAAVGLGPIRMLLWGA